MATARAAVGPRRSGRDNPGEEEALRKELDAAEREVDEAAQDIQGALQPGTVLLGLVLNRAAQRL